MSTGTPVFVISLAQSGRCEKIAAQMARWKGSWSFYDAVDGRLLTVSERRALYDEKKAIRNMGRPLAPGEIGCALSHAGIYRRMAELGLERAIVLEDDAVLTDRFFEFPFDSIDWKFDVISFYSGNAIVRRQAAQFCAGLSFHRVAWDARHSVAYLVSREGAAALAAANRPVVSDADWPIYTNRARFFVTQPFLAGHSYENSLLNTERNSLTRSWSKDGALPRWLQGRMEVLASASFLRYVLNRDRFAGPRDYAHRVLAPYIMRKLPSRYLTIGRR